MTRRVAVARRSATRAIAGARPGRDRDHQPARDRGRLGPADRRAGPQRARLAGPPDRRALRRAARGGPHGRSSASARAWSSTRTSPAPRSSGCCATSRPRATPSSARSTPGSSSSSPAATSPTTRTPRGRCCSTSASCAGTRELCELLGVDPEASLPEPVPLRRRCTGAPTSSAATSRWRGSRATSRRRCSARPATRPGMAKNTYGTGSFVLLNTGRRGARARRGPADHRRLGPRGAHRLRARGAVFVTGAAVQWLRDGLGIIGEAAETEAPGGLARLQRRRLLRARADRARLAALGSLRARHDRRPHPRHRPRPARPRRAGGDRLPDGRRGARPGGGRRARRSPSCGPTAARSPTAG